MSTKTHDELTVVGVTGKPAEMRYFSNGNPVTKFSVACDRSYLDKTKNEWVNRTIWYNCEVFGKLAEIANERIRAKGMKIFLTGELVPDWETGAPRLWTRQDGTAGASYEVRVNHLVFFDKRENGEEYSDTPAQAEYVDAGDIPF